MQKSEHSRKWRTVGPLALALLALGLLASARLRLFSLAHAAPALPEQVLPGAPQSGGLTVMAREGVQSEGPATGLYDFGRVDPLGTARLEHTFTLRNEGKAPVSLDRVAPSCGCTSILLGTDKEATKHTLAPGQEIRVQVSVDISHFGAGALQKYVWAYAAGSQEPAATMKVTARIMELVSYSPQLLDFGSTPAGSARAVPFSMTLDARLLAGAAPQLVSSNPDVRVTPDAKEAPTAAKEGRRFVRTYTVTLSPKAHLGFVSGTLFFPSTRSAAEATVTGAPVKAPAPSAAAALARVSVPLRGEVVGKVSAAPRMVFFTTVKIGQEVTRQVKLSETAAGGLKGLKVTCGAPWLSARLKAPEHGAAPAAAISGNGSEAASAPLVQVLELTLGPSAPPGSLQTQVTVTTADGERLVLPVHGYVLPQKSL